jgi:hypothetical protein
MRKDKKRLSSAVNRIFPPMFEPIFLGKYADDF